MDQHWHSHARNLTSFCRYCFSFLSILLCLWLQLPFSIFMMCMVSQCERFKCLALRFNFNEVSVCACQLNKQQLNAFSLINYGKTHFNEKHWASAHTHMRKVQRSGGMSVGVGALIVTSHDSARDSTHNSLASDYLDDDRSRCTLYNAHCTRIFSLHWHHRIESVPCMWLVVCTLRVLRLYEWYA